MPSHVPSHHPVGTGALSSPQRLSAALTRVLARQGYPALTVAKVIAEASVSRATFYQYFDNVEDCFFTAYRDRALDLHAMLATVGGSGAERELAVLDALVEFARSSPAITQMLMREGLAAGPQGILERDGLIALAASALGRDDQSRASVSRIDLPAEVLVGGVFRFLALGLSGAGTDGALGEGLRQWARTLVRGPGERAWGALFTPAAPRVQPPPPPPRASRSARRGARRERIIQATAAAVREKGYAAVTVADIVAAAGVSRRLFYDEFHGKPDAYVASYEHAFQHTLAACTPAFFAAQSWPERVWLGARAFTGYFSREPALAHLGFVECYAPGPDFRARAHDTQLAFTLFLEDGYRQRPEAALLPRACSTLTMASIFEAAFQASRWGAALHMRRMQPLAVYVALAPFIGAEQAGAFVSAKLSERPGRGCSLEAA